MGSIVIDSGEMIKGNPNDSNMLISESKIQNTFVYWTDVFIPLILLDFVKDIMFYENRCSHIKQYNILLYPFTFLDLYHVQLKYTTIL